MPPSRRLLRHRIIGVVDGLGEARLERPQPVELVFDVGKLVRIELGAAGDGSDVVVIEEHNLVVLPDIGGNIVRIREIVHGNLQSLIVSQHGIRGC